MRVVDIKDFCIPSDENDYDELVAFADTMASISQFDAVPMSVIDDLRAEIEDYITHSPYIKSFLDCCRLRDDVMRIFDKHMKEGE